MRQGIHDMIHEQVNLIKQIEINLKNIPTDSIKLKFENMVQKKLGVIETLGKNLIEQEKQFMSIKKLQTKVFKKLRIGPPKSEQDKKQKASNGEEYELQNLLEESSSDEEGDNNKDEEDDDDSDDSWANDETDATLKESDFMIEED